MEWIKPTLVRILVVATRTVAISSLVIFVWITIGAVWFPEWWYRVFWNAKVMDPGYLREGLQYLVDNELVLLICFSVATIATLVVTHFYHRRFLAILDAWALRITLICLGALMVVALLLYRTQSERVEAMNDIERVSNATQALLQDKGWTAPPIQPPVDFRYLDGPRVDGLYSELESEFPERERTISSERSRSLIFGVGGSKAEGSGKASEISSYQRKDLSAERKCVELINTLLSKQKMPYYTTATDWNEHELERIRRVLAASIINLADLMEDGTKIIAEREESKAKSLQKVQLDLSSKLRDTLLQPQTKEELKRLQEGANRSMQVELSRASGLVIFDGSFRKIVETPDNQIFEALFAKTPRRITFRFALGAQKKASPIKEGGRLRVFGSIIHELESGGYVEILPIAIF